MNAQLLSKKNLLIGGLVLGAALGCATTGFGAAAAKDADELSFLDGRRQFFQQAVHHPEVYGGPLSDAEKATLIAYSQEELAKTAWGQQAIDAVECFFANPEIHHVLCEMKKPIIPGWGLDISKIPDADLIGLMAEYVKNRYQKKLEKALVEGGYADKVVPTNTLVLVMGDFVIKIDKYSWRAREWPLGDYPHGLLRTVYDIKIKRFVEKMQLKHIKAIKSAVIQASGSYAVVEEFIAQPKGFDPKTFWPNLYDRAVGTDSKPGDAQAQELLHDLSLLAFYAFPAIWDDKKIMDNILVFNEKEAIVAVVDTEIPGGDFASDYPGRAKCSVEVLMRFCGVKDEKLPGYVGYAMKKLAPEFME